jgi:hypothetical protein
LQWGPRCTWLLQLTMRIQARFYAVLLVTLILGLGASAKCPRGTVTVNGRVDNLPVTAVNVQILITLTTTKETLSRTASVFNDEFTIDVSFSTRSSSFLGGDRCHAEPKFVEVSVEVSGKLYGPKKLQFAEDFEMYKPFFYREKRPLSIDVSPAKSQTDLRKPPTPRH